MTNSRSATARLLLTAAAALSLLLLPGNGWAQDLLIRYGNTSAWPYDNRDDQRDFPSNGSFPGNFAANPASTWTGAAGFLGSNPQRSTLAYPSQVVFGVSPSPRRERIITAHGKRHRGRM